MTAAVKAGHGIDEGCRLESELAIAIALAESRRLDLREYRHYKVLWETTADQLDAAQRHINELERAQFTSSV
jgi:hypothetical protein